jgi:hypothetical protein
MRNSFPPSGFSLISNRLIIASLTAGLVALVQGGPAFAAAAAPNRNISIGTMQMRGKPAAPAVYDVGTLGMIGQAGVGTSFDVGTLMLTGQTGVGTVFEVGTLTMMGQTGAGSFFDVGTLSMTGLEK